MSTSLPKPGYGWEPLPIYDFMEGMKVAGPGRYRRFLDVGSGIGEKLAIAKLLGWTPYGIERNKSFIEASWYYWPDYLVTEIDAFDFDHYGDYDLVYCYRPCLEAKDQTELNHIISEQLKPGAYFFCAGGPYPDWLEHVEGQVWRTHS